MKIRIIVILILTVLFNTLGVFAQDIKSARRGQAKTMPGSADAPIKINNAALIREAGKLNNKTVIIAGEVIGDVMRRGDFSWFNINDESDMIGIKAPAQMAAKITDAGAFEYVGDIVEIKGVFVRTDRKTGGELYVDAGDIKILKPGYKIFHVVEPLKIKTTLTLSLIMLCLGGLKWMIKKK